MGRAGETQRVRVCLHCNSALDELDTNNLYIVSRKGKGHFCLGKISFSCFCKIVLLSHICCIFQECTNTQKEMQNAVIVGRDTRKLYLDV